MSQNSQPLPLWDMHEKSLEQGKGKSRMGRLSDYGEMDDKATLEGINDIAGVEVTITSVRFIEGQHGEFAVFECTDPDGVVHVVSTGAMFLMDKFRDAVKQDALPLEAKFFLKGRYKMVE